MVLRIIKSAISDAKAYLSESCKKMTKLTPLGLTSYLYSSFKKLIKDTTLFTKFSVSGDVIRYSKGRFSFVNVEYTYTRLGITKTYIDDIIEGFPSLKLYSKGLFDKRAKLVGFGATAIVLETLQFAENVYTYIIAPSLDGFVETTDASDASDASKIQIQTENIRNLEKCLYENDEFYDFISQIEVTQIEEDRPLSKKEIIERFYSYKGWELLYATLKQFLVVGITLVFLIANIFNIPLTFTVTLTFVAAGLIIISAGYFSAEVDQKAENVKNALSQDSNPADLLRAMEAILRLKRRSRWISSETKKELKQDEKLLRTLRQLSIVKNQKILDSVSKHPTYENYSYKQLDKYKPIIEKIDLTEGVKVISTNLCNKYSTWELIKKEFKILFRSIYSKLAPALTYLLIFSLLTAMFPVGIYSAVYLAIFMIPVQGFIISPIENWICRKLYQAFRFKALLPAIRFFVSDKTLHEYDCIDKSDDHKCCLDLIRAANSPIIFKDYPALAKEVTTGTRFEYDVS